MLQTCHTRTISHWYSPHDITGTTGLPAYIVKTIFNLCCKNGKLQYLIEWEGYGPEEQCWIPAHDILHPILCQEIYGGHLQHPGLHHRGRPRRSMAPRVSLSGDALAGQCQNLQETLFPRTHCGIQHGCHGLHFPTPTDFVMFSHRTSNHTHLNTLTTTQYYNHTQYYATSPLWMTLYVHLPEFTNPWFLCWDTV